MVHIAIIMDGNGRWAKQRGLPRMEGHVAGLRTFQTIALHGAKLGLEFMTVYAFSVQNWSRPVSEIKGLFELANSCFANLELFQKANIRLRVQGFLDLYPASVQKTIQTAIQQTEKNTGMVLTIALSYGGQEEIVTAVEALCRAGHMGPIMVQDFEAVINPDKIPSPDLIVRTSGEFRVSNFLLWQSAYAEYWIVDTLWPDFTPADLEKALGVLQARDRRFGKVGTSLPSCKILSFSETSTQFKALFEKAGDIKSPFSEMQKYVNNSFMRTKYASLYSTALTSVPQTYEEFTEACETLWTALTRYLGTELSLKLWLRSLYVGAWLQTRHPINSTCWRNTFLSLKKSNPVEVFRFLKQFLTGPNATESEEIIKEHLLDLSESQRSMYLEFMEHCLNSDLYSIAHGIMMALLPFQTEGITVNDLYKITFFLLAILYPQNLPASSLQCVEFALSEIGSTSPHPLLAKLKTGLVYFYLLTDKQQIPSILHFLQYIHHILGIPEIQHKN